MMDAIEARLRSQVTALRLVAGAGEYAQLTAPPREKLPAAYVLPMDDTARPNGMASKVLRQQLTRRVAVVILATNARDPRGDAAASSLEPLVYAMRAAMVGWTPAIPTQPATGARITTLEPFELVGGSLSDISDSVVAWTEQYALSAALTLYV